MRQATPARNVSISQLHHGGLAVRTGLRGGVCVDVNDEVKSALQTLTNALGGMTTAATTTVNSTAAS